MENAVKIIEVDFVNRRRRREVPAGYDLARLSKHTEKFEAWQKKVEARRQAREDFKESCESVKNCVYETLEGTGVFEMTKKDLRETLVLAAEIGTLVFGGSVMACVLR